MGVDEVSHRSVLVTGATGNLGRKLMRLLIDSDWCSKVVATDRAQEPLADLYGREPKVRTVVLDLIGASDGQLADLVSSVDTIVHFAVANPLPDSTWEEAAFSFDMTARLLTVARDLGLRRFVFASSNHALGRYKDPPLSETLAPGCLSTDLFAPGTKWETLDGVIDGYAYGAAKIFAERMCLALAQRSGISTVAIRVGWCQAGENQASTLNASGNPTLAQAGATSKSGEAELSWFRNMWLSTPDFRHLFERAILADPQGWPAPGIVINGMSGNTGMAWDIAPARSLIGYRPSDDVWASLRSSSALGPGAHAG